jgi:hypothetical protein
MEKEMLPPFVLNFEVRGYNLSRAPLSAHLSRPSLVVFLRHLGSPFSKEVVRDLRRVAAADPGYPAVLFVSMATKEEAASFAGPLWPDARVVADPHKVLYDALGVERGGMREMVGPRSVVRALQAAAKGHLRGSARGDRRVLPTYLVVVDGRVLWRFDGGHAGHRPDFGSIPRLAGLRA